MPDALDRFDMVLAGDTIQCRREPCGCTVRRLVDSYGNEREIDLDPAACQMRDTGHVLVLHTWTASCGCEFQETVDSGLKSLRRRVVHHFAICAHHRQQGGEWVVSGMRRSSPTAFFRWRGRR